MRICAHVQKEKNIPSGQDAHHSLGQNAHVRAWAFYPTVLSVGILPRTCDYCGDGNLKINGYQWHKNADNLVTNNNLIFGQYMWYNSGNMRAIFFKYGVKNRGVRRPRAYYPALYMLLPYVTTNCSVHFKFDIFTYNGHNRDVDFSMNLTEKRISYQNCGFIFINLRLLDPCEVGYLLLIWH